MAKGYRSASPMGGAANANMMKQAQKMQQEMMKLQADLETRTYTASAGGGTVRAEANGKHELVSLTVEPDAVDPDDVEMLQDMIIAAVNEALRAADEDASSSMSKFTGGLNFGGLL